jgi:predicted  nucleic acid-binding Zn-ribbon protein
MASVRSTIELVITGATRGLGAAAAEASAMADRIAAAEDKVSEARTRSAAAEDKVHVAEERLQAVRAGQEAALSRIGVAETNLERVRATAGEATTRLAGAQADLDAVRARSGATAQEIADAESRVNQVRTESDQASRRLQAAEAQLASARANAARSSSQVASAEAEIRRARSEAVRASEDLARRENDLNAIRRRGTDDMDRQRSGILGIFDALGGLVDAFTGADGAATSLGAKMGALNSVFSSIGGPIVQSVVGLVQFAAILAAIGEIVGVVGGLIGQAFAGVPVLLLAAAAAAGTVALGLDGIKKAAQAAEPAFNKLKTAVSDVFIRQLTPAFRDLAAALPKLTDGFRFVAVALSGIAQQVIGFVTSARGIETINGILRGTATLLSSMAPGLSAFVQGLLLAANVGRTAFAALGTAIGSVFQRIGDVFSQLAADGTIGRAVQGLASTLTGLGAVVAPLISLFIQMGAALGDSVGVALTGVGDAITQVTPFFVKLADVAGKVLVDAFKQLGPPLGELVDSLLPGAGQGMDGFASVMHNVVLPAIAGFINFLRTDAIPGIVAFTQGAIIQFTSFGSQVLVIFSSILLTVRNTFLALATIPSPFQKQFLDAASATEGFRLKVDGLKTSIDNVHDKTVQMVANTPSGPLVGEQGILGVNAAIDAAHDKTVTTTANVPGGPLLGKQGNDLLKGAIDVVPNKQVTTQGNVPSGPTVGRQGNDDLVSAIGRVLSKTVSIIANVTGLGAVLDLIGAIGRVVGKTVNIVANVIGAGASLLGFASGGRVPTSGVFLVGEHGPELLTLDAFGGVVTPADRTQQILAQRRTQPAAAAPPDPAAAGGGGEQPITVNVMLSQEQIAGIAQVEIQRRDRATKRTVLAGSGVTF